MEAGVTYHVDPRPSERQPPWTYDIVRDDTQAVIATSDPVFEDLDLDPVPRAAASWAVREWIECAGHSIAWHTVDVAEGEKANDFFQRRRSTILNDLTPEAVRYRVGREREDGGFRLGEARSLDESELRWVQHWRSRQRYPDGTHRYGVSLHTMVGELLYSSTYWTDAISGEAADDAAAEERCRTWEAHLIEAASPMVPNTTER